MFLRSAGIAAVAPVIAPMVPAEAIVKYFFAPADGWKGTGNQFLTMNWVTEEALRILHENLKLTIEYPVRWGDGGQNLAVRRPSRYLLGHARNRDY